MKIGSLFSGYGGLDLAIEDHFNAETAWHAELEEAPSKVLAHHWPAVPNLKDVTQVNWAEVEPVDIIAGGFPCQDVSAAGKRAGMVDGTRSNLWGAMRTAVEVIRPQYVIVENVRGLLSAKAESEADSNLEHNQGFMGNETDVNLRAIGRVLGDLADLGYDAQWCGVFASDIGAPHSRFRVFILATHTKHNGRFTCKNRGSNGKAPSTGGRLASITQSNSGKPSGRYNADSRTGDIQTKPAWGAYEPAIRRWENCLQQPTPRPTEPTGKDGAQRLSPKFVEWMMGLPEGWVTGVPEISRADQIKMLGNGVVPQQAAHALKIMTEGWKEIDNSND